LTNKFRKNIKMPKNLKKMKIRMMI
jgi:hypothetical protein